MSAPVFGGANEGSELAVLGDQLFGDPRHHAPILKDLAIAETKKVEKHEKRAA